MAKNLFFIIVFCWLSSPLALGQQSWYVSQANGSDSNNGSSPQEALKSVDHAVDFLNPGDTLFFMGNFVNPSYDPDYAYSDDIYDPYIWHQENTIKIVGLNGTPGNYITFKAYDENTILKGSGANILRVTNCSYLRFKGLEIEGEVENIPLSTALALQFLYDDGSGAIKYRVQPGTSETGVKQMTFESLRNVSRPSYTDTRGIYMSDVHHIDIIDNKVHHMPGNGLRVAKGDYINIIGNEVHNCSRKSYSGTHGLVVTKSTSIDKLDDYKIFILKNEVHHNFNEIYSWNPGKTFITPRIDEGKGISLQRNTEAYGWMHGRILIANNVAYWNGFSGVHSNVGTRIEMINNTCYMNSYTNTVTYETDKRGNNIGISTSDGSDIKIINNIAVIDTDWGGFPVSSANTSGIVVENNLVCGINGNVSEDSDVTGIQVNTIEEDPLFTDVANFDFSLQGSSAAIGGAGGSYAPDYDFRGALRDDNPDLGAYEYFRTSSIGDAVEQNISVWPNPFSDNFNISGVYKADSSIALYDFDGNNMASLIDISYQGEVHLTATRLMPGSYILVVNNHSMVIVKR